MAPVKIASSLKKLSLLGVMALFATIPSAKATAQSLPSVENVQTAIRQFKGQPVSFDELKMLREHFKTEPNEVIYRPISWLRASQNRISFERVLTKAIELFKKNDLHWHDGGLVSELPFDHHQSLIPESRAIPVVLLPDGSLAIVDGHHEVLASVLAGAQTVPIKIVLDLSRMRSIKGAWAKLVKLHMAYLKNLNGTFSEEPRPLNLLENDPNRFLLSLIAKRIKTVKDGNKLTLSYTDSPEDVWVKLDDGIPFIEFEIADILYQHGIVYRPEWGDQIPVTVIKKIRAVLIREKAKGNQVLKNVALIRTDASGAHPVEDPNVHFAGLINRVIVAKKNGNKVKTTEGADRPVWISLEDDEKNAQVEIAAALYKSGQIFDRETEGMISEEATESARKIIAKQKAADPTSLQGVAVVKKDVPPSKINFNKVFQVLKARGQYCTRLLCI